ncbi:MAG TPA: PolC-type DNA polymerase III, partial [Oribacterium sp.]|nr:PolC-type DNA polymerase III [Oribacterium sp.]
MKKFFEVFDTLELSKEAEALLTDTFVTRVTITRDRKLIRIHILSAHLIDKRTIYALEKAIKEQIFARKEITVRVAEEFHLSAQYNARTLYGMYSDSILLEMKNYDIVLYNMLSRGKLRWTADDEMSLTVPDSRLYKNAARKLESALQSIFEKRCHLELLLDMQYEERKIEAPAQLDRDYVPEERMDDAAARRQRMQEQEGFMDTRDPFNLAGMDQAAGGAAAAALSEKSDPRTNRPATAAAPSGASAPAGAAGTRTASSPQKEGGYSNRFGGAGAGTFQRRKRAFRMSENEDVLYGRYFEGDPVKLEDVDASSGNVIVAGQIFLVHDPVHTRTGKNILKFDVTDFTDSISVKIFVEDEDLELANSFVKPGTALKIKGTVSFDSFDKQVEMSFIDGIVRYQLNRTRREDTYPEKRVELHLHTKMSDMDGVTDVNDYIDTAISFGMKAMAITDHGVVQAFPDANIYLKKIKHDKDFKLIYGCEGYLVDDLETIVQNEKGQDLQHETVVFDIETTGFSAETDHIIEIGAVKLQNNEIVDRMDVFVNPGVPIPFRITQLTSIDDSMVMDADPIEKVLPDFLRWCGDAVIVAHNASFDTGFIAKNAKRLGLSYDPTILDTVGLSRLLLPQLNRYKLDTVAKELGVSLEHHHRAVDDAACTAEIYMKEIELVKARGAERLADIDHLEFDHAANVMKLPSYHIVLLAKNDVGRINLYRLISESHLKYFKSRPRIPKSLLRELREGLIIGSACVAGEVFQGLVRGMDEQQLLNVASFYDYLEVQPLGNNSFMIASDKYTASSEQDLIDYNRKIIDLADQLGKPVCATCDCHYVDEEDDIYRRIIQAGRGFDEEESDAKLYFRTTKEMLDEFSYLEPEKAHEIVIDNPNMIADMCDKIRPVRPDKCPPVIEHSDETLRQICHETAHRIYGPTLPKIVSDRLETELNSIISNGYSVMYIIAQKLVDKSNEDGYLVGSRGSVGSSFAATMAHITEVNPLSPHYVCPKCYWYDFDSPEVKKYSGMAGCDMPPKKCPKCGTELNRMGFDIPFETFLGFNGDKEPDIDLNFSGEYQSKAHKYTEVIFGYGQTFRAGTIGTLAEKTAYGYVMKYYEERGIHKRRCEIGRIAEGCTGVRRSTGQHPGGIVVLPLGEEINSFTPVQHPANDMTTDIVTTHFDYHKIDHNLLKLDILGH